MHKASREAILQRIDERLAATGKTDQGASIEAGIGKDAIRDMRRKTMEMPGIKKLEALAPVLETRPEYLAWGVTPDENTRAPRSVAVIGAVAAGLWLDIDGEIDQPTYEHSELPVDARYPHAAQFGLIVVGSSVNKVAKEGEVLHCVDIGLTGIDPANGDLVIVERRRAQNSQKEVTAKRVSRKGRIIRLAPDSDDPRWQTAKELDPADAPEGEEIAIIAIVIGVYRPLRR